MGLLRTMLAQLGIEPDRLRLEWISASEGERLRDVMNEFSAQIRQLGPLETKSSVISSQSSVAQAAP